MLKKQLKEVSFEKLMVLAVAQMKLDSPDSPDSDFDDVDMENLVPVKVTLNAFSLGNEFFKSVSCSNLQETRLC